MVLSLVLSLLLGIANYLSERISLHCSGIRAQLISLVSGISVAYIFLSLLPELYQGVSVINRSLFIFVLLGFALFHVIEKFIFIYVGKGRISEDLHLNHSIGLFFYDFSVGIVLVNFIHAGLAEGILFFIAVLPHTALSNLSITKIHGLHHHKEMILENKFAKLFLAGATLYGAVMASVLNIDIKVVHTLTGLVAGILLYVVIRETLPKDKDGNPLYFVIGVLLYSLLTFWIWSLT